jgi:CheY-like chemotaxis protein
MVMAGFSLVVPRAVERRIESSGLHSLFRRAPDAIVAPACMHIDQHSGLSWLDNALHAGRAVTSQDIAANREDLICIVDDDLGVCEFIASCLRAAGFSVAMAQQGSDAVERAIHLHPRAIILDLEMPIMDGLAVLCALKSDERTHAIPVVMLSGSSEREWPVLARRSGGAACLPKPSSAEMLVETVRNVLRPHH